MKHIWPVIIAALALAAPVAAQDDTEVEIAEPAYVTVADTLDPGPDASAEARGLFIATRSDRSDRGFGDSEATLQMILRNASGEESTRSLRQTVLEVPDETVGDKSINVFDSPRDVEGTALLSHAKILDADDQWLYLPALKRVKRISSANKSGPFLGSEFAFEDFTAQELGKFSYTYIGEEACGELVCDIVERTPLYAQSGYTKQIVWIDQTHYQFRKVEFYDRGERHFKTLTFSDYREYRGGVWRAHLLKMINHQTGKETDLIFSEFEFGRGFSDSDFVRARLSRL